MIYEVIFEDGSHSVADYSSEEDMLEAVSAHHARAVAGEEGGTPGRPAIRVKRVLYYEDGHPADYLLNQTLLTSEVKSEVTAWLKEQAAEVNVQELAAYARSLSDPAVSSDAHESNYKQSETSEVSANKWGGE